ncbi:MAG: hypothetical protein GXP30_12455 [Verrucomicrobia bacterium]|nr:hypothetical protein [Verrucomicrobiota bacterium]
MRKKSCNRVVAHAPVSHTFPATLRSPAYSPSMPALYRRYINTCIVALFPLLTFHSASAQVLDNKKAFQLDLPTDNNTIFSRDPSQFYMYTNRSFEGVSSRPWTAGRYGFVRNQRRTSHGIIFTRFHEGH